MRGSFDHRVKVNAGKNRGYTISWTVQHRHCCTTTHKTVDYRAAERFAKKWKIEDQLRAGLRSGEVIEWDN